jgi:hypothetical protein
METKLFVSEHGNFTVYAQFELDEEGMVYNENVVEFGIYAGSTNVIHVEGKDYLDLLNCLSTVAQQKFLHNQNTKNNIGDK